MKYILILFISFMISCSKDESCKNYNLVTESSIDSARDKCDGLANSHPEMKILSSKSIGCLTSDELKEAKKAESTITQTYCPGVTYTVRVTVK